MIDVMAESGSLLQDIATPNISTPMLCEDEAAYKNLFIKSIQSAASPFEIALKAGLCADRMAWVFIAGYQAAIRACFNPAQFEDHKDDHWLCLAVSEPSPESGKPGVSAVIQGGDFLLTGFKSWIAASDSVDSMIVKAGRSEKAVCLYLPANAEHLKITRKADPKLLVELSQGEAFFDNVYVNQNQALDRLSLKVFPKFEAFYIYVAMVASIYAHTCKADAPTSDKALDFLEMTSKVRLVKDTEITRLERVPDFINQQFHVVYEAYKNSPCLWKFSNSTDENLLSAYSKMLIDAEA